jgi:hypothetical protein
MDLKHQPLNHQMQTPCLFGARNSGIPLTSLNYIYIIDQHFDSVVLLRLAKQDMKLGQLAMLEASSSKQKWHSGLVEALYSTDCLGVKYQFRFSTARCLLKQLAPSPSYPIRHVHVIPCLKSDPLASQLGISSLVRATQGAQGVASHHKTSA